MYKKILMAYDGSPEYRRALRQGSEMAELTNAEVHLLAVIRSLSLIHISEPTRPY